MAHLIPGTKETLSLKQAESNEQIWTQTLAAWHMVTIDLLVLTTVFLLLALGYIPDTHGVLPLLLYGWLAVWTLAWLLVVGVGSRDWHYVYKLPQWVVFVLLIGLAYMGFG